jgi:SAM-dependent methyltransferase
MSDTQWYRPCQVCGEENEAIVYRNQLAEIDGQDMSYDVATCAHCGFHYAAYLPEPEQYQHYYRALSKYDVVLPASAVPAVDRYRAEQAVRFVSDVLEGKECIVDLGCGCGTLLNAFSQAGWQNLHGFDPAPNAHHQAKSIYGLEGVQTGTLAEVADSQWLQNAELVCLMGVLEHLPELRKDLQVLCQQLGAASKLLLEVPASERFVCEDFEPFGEFSLEHIQFFSMSSLNHLMASLGWKPLKTMILELPTGTTDSLLCLYEQGIGLMENEPDDTALDLYLRDSGERLETALAKIHQTHGPLIIFGAGSHTARLLPYLSQQGCSERVLAIIDNNDNLEGKKMGRWQIHKPDELLPRYPDATVLVSSYRSQQAIADALQQHYPNPILKIYSANDH